jgi:hypothetical protein
LGWGEPEGRLFVGVLGQEGAAKKLCRLTSCLKRYTERIKRFSVLKNVEEVRSTSVYNAYITLYNNTDGV